MNVPAKKKSWRWPIAIVAMLGLHAVGMVGVMLVATNDPSFSVEPNHYQKALAWDAQSARRRASDALGWKVDLRTDARLDATQTRGLECRIVDGGGNPVTGATVALLAFPHARGEERVRMDLRESDSGLYSTRAPMVRSGLWEVRLSARRGPDYFTSTLMHTTTGMP